MKRKHHQDERDKHCFFPIMQITSEKDIKQDKSQKRENQRDN
jgi:hypothetical protein